MKDKEIIARMAFLHYNKETDPILNTLNAHELKHHVSFPYGGETTISRDNYIIIDEITFLIKDITIDIFKPEGHHLEYNLQVLVYVEEKEFE